MRLSRVSLAHAMMALLVTSLDGSTTSGHEVRNSSITQMLKWFTKNGGILHANLEYRVQSNVRRGGMFAIGNISKGSTLCLVPARLFYDPLNRSTTARLPTREKVLSETEEDLQAGIEAAKNVAMALREVDQDFSGVVAPTDESYDFWAPYLLSLPRTCENIICGSLLPNNLPVVPSEFFYRRVELKRKAVPSEAFVAYSLYQSRAW